MVIQEEKSPRHDIHLENDILEQIPASISEPKANESNSLGITIN